jgi:hypothetical protein
MLKLSACVVVTVILGSGATAQPTPDHPAVTVQGRSYTPRSILTRNMGAEADQTAKKIAAAKSVGYQTQLRMWIAEGIRREAKRG